MRPIYRCLTAKVFVALFGLLFCLFQANPMFAQATGRIGGIVTDASGAVVPGATVVCQNLTTGVSRTAVSNGDGIFVFPDLPIGQYALQVEMQGFQTYRNDQIPLVTAQVIDMKVVLQVGDINQKIEVTGQAPLVSVASSSVQTSVTEKPMQDLPLNGRNAYQLTTLTPGTVITDVGTDSGQEDNRGLSVNGLRATENNFQLDGTMYTNRFFDSAPTMPNPDTLEEFTVQSSDYSAQYGGAGALVQLSTRSGSNKFHGTAFEFVRNTKLNARNFFALTLPPFKLNQYGGTIGGPIKKNKTFFFFSAQGTQRISSPSPVSITVPSAAERTGNFSQLLPKTITNPATGQPFPGNIITQLDTVSLAIANQYIPLPNSGAQWVGTTAQNLTDKQWLLKIDEELTNRNHFVGRYFYDEDNFQRPFSAPTGFFAENYYRNQSLTLSDTQTFSPTLTATFSTSFGRFARTQVPEAPGLKTLQMLGQQDPVGTSVPIFPGVRCNISGYIDIFSGGALIQDPTTFDYIGSVVKVWGLHTLNFGGHFERSRIDTNDYSFTPGDNTFNGQVSGNAVADFYIGAESQFFQDNGRRFSLREDRPALYVQDDWKVRRQLTVNVGLRWDPWLPPIDLNSTLTAFVPGQQSTVAPNAPLGMLFPGDKGIAATVFHQDWRDFAPRVGFAWNVGGNGKTVVRSAYGIFYGFPEGDDYVRTDAQQPVNLYLSIPAPPSFDNPYLGFAGGDPFPRGHVSPSQFATYKFVLPISGGLLDPSSKVAYTQNWNFTVEHQMSNGLAISVAYVGNHGLGIMDSRQFNPALYYTGATVAQENNHRLYPGFGAVEWSSSYAYDEYNALQINVTRRVSKGLSLLSNFVWSKTMDNQSTDESGNAGPNNPFNFKASRGPADFNQAARFSLSPVYTTPHFAVTGYKKVLANDWQVNAIATLQSGLPFTVVSGTDRSISGIGNDFADQVLPSVARPAGVSRILEYFNTAAFAPAALGTFGDAGRNAMRGPGYFDVDTSIFKNFYFTEKLYLQFRAEAFNIENRANLQNPSASVVSGTYGKITAAYDPRVLQFALKLFF